MARAKAGLLTVLDVRPEDESRAGHLPGALNTALRDLQQRQSDLDPTREVIAYCRGACCVLPLFRLLPYATWSETPAGWLMESRNGKLPVLRRVMDQNAGGAEQCQAIQFCLVSHSLLVMMNTHRHRTATMARTTTMTVRLSGENGRAKVCHFGPFW